MLLDLDEGNLSCGFRIWISGARDRGLGTEAVELTLRDALLFDGTWVDAHMMGMPAADWAERRAAIAPPAELAGQVRPAVEQWRLKR